MSCANDHFFLDAAEHTRMKKLAQTGITLPEQIKIERNSVLYRVGHSNKDFNMNLTSPWWMSDASFDYLRRETARPADDMRLDRAFRKMYRNKLAVAHCFGPGDVLVKVAVRQRLRAFTGRGGHVIDDKSADIPIQWIGGFEIAQYFIPGLRLENDSASPICRAALEVLAYQPLASFILARQGM